MRFHHTKKDGFYDQPSVYWQRKDEIHRKSSPYLYSGGVQWPTDEEVLKQEYASLPDRYRAHFEDVLRIDPLDSVNAGQNMLTNQDMFDYCDAVWRQEMQKASQESEETNTTAEQNEQQDDYDDSSSNEDDDDDDDKQDDDDDSSSDEDDGVVSVHDDDESTSSNDDEGSSSSADETSSSGDERDAKRHKPNVPFKERDCPIHGPAHKYRDCGCCFGGTNFCPSEAENFYHGTAKHDPEFKWWVNTYHKSWWKNDNHQHDSNQQQQHYVQPQQYMQQQQQYMQQQQQPAYYQGFHYGAYQAPPAPASNYYGRRVGFGTPNGYSTWHP